MILSLLMKAFLLNATNWDSYKQSLLLRKRKEAISITNSLFFKIDDFMTLTLKEVNAQSSGHY